MINKVIIIGRLTRDVDLRMTTTGAQVCSFTLAVDNRYINKETNERSASFINCVAWSALAKTISTYVRKGSLICVEGRLQSRTYDTKDGRRASVTEVICDNVQFLGPKDSNNANPGFAIEEPDTTDNEPLPYSDEDLPF